MMTENESFEWNRICFAYADIVEQMHYMDLHIEKLEAEIARLEQYESMVHFIADDYIELSYEKAQWQRDDWLKRCKKIIAEEK
jgi:hypothetical protein